MERGEGKRKRKGKELYAYVEKKDCVGKRREYSVHDEVQPQIYDRQSLSLSFSEHHFLFILFPPFPSFLLSFYPLPSRGYYQTCCFLPSFRLFPTCWRIKRPNLRGSRRDLPRDSDISGLEGSFCV